ncbi:aspartate/glutamate racemase family protein [Spirillospora sp. NBC_00431]
MKHLGILAHSVEGAALCLRAFCQEGFRELGPDDHPDVSLDLIAMARSMPAWDAGDHDPIRATLGESVRRLAAAGADFFACPDNTAHLALERPGGDLPLPGLHIARVVADQAARDGRARVGVLGTRYTMDGPVYPRELAARGIAAEVPDAADRDTVHRIIFDELVNGVFTDEIAARVRRGHRAARRTWVRRRRAGVHRDPAAGHARCVAAADTGFHPPARPCRLRGGRRAASSSGVARRARRRFGR